MAFCDGFLALGIIFSGFIHFEHELKYFIPFDGQIIFDPMDVFICWWTFGLFSDFGFKDAAVVLFSCSVMSDRTLCDPMG